LKTFTLADEYDKVKLESSQFGNGKMLIPEDSDKFVIREIQRLEK